GRGRIPRALHRGPEDLLVPLSVRRHHLREPRGGLPLHRLPRPVAPRRGATRPRLRQAPEGAPTGPRQQAPRGLRQAAGARQAPLRGGRHLTGRGARIRYHRTAYPNGSARDFMRFIEWWAGLSPWLRFGVAIAFLLLS